MMAGIPPDPITPKVALASGIVAHAAVYTVQSQEDQLKVVQPAGTIDHFTAHCSCIAPTRPELLLCLQGNAAALSVSTALTAACRNAMAAIRQQNY
jgi:hypothetical protein